MIIQRTLNNYICLWNTICLVFFTPDDLRPEEYVFAGFFTICLTDVTCLDDEFPLHAHII